MTKSPDRKLRRNWKVWNLAYKYEDEWFLETARRVVEEMPDPWPVQVMGRPPHPPKGLFLSCVYKVKKKIGYRGVESELEANPGLVKKLCLLRPVGKSTLQEAMDKIPEEYADKFLRKLNEKFKENEKHLVTDGTGFGTNRYEKFMRKGEEEMRRKFQMYYFIGTHYWKLILSQRVSRTLTGADSVMFRENLKDVSFGETIAGDKAYISKLNCELADQKGLKPYFAPKDNMSVKSEGPKPYERMLQEYYGSREAWDPLYHTRSIAETLVGRLKQRTGKILSSISETIQKIEVKLKGIVNNLLVLNLVRASHLLGEPPLVPV